MSRARTPGKRASGWSKRTRSRATDPANVSQQLNHRQLNSLEDCRLAWETDMNPVAVCAAISKSDLPEWLVDACLVLLVDGGEGGKFQRPLWKRFMRDATDAQRALMSALARTDPTITPPPTWEVAYKLADSVVSKLGGSAVSPGMMKKSYNRVAKNLNQRGRYFGATWCSENGC